MTDIRRPRRGSLAVRPRKRARSLLHKLNVFNNKRDLDGFIGYKAGMVSFSYKIKLKDGSFSEVSNGTIIEVPPLRVYGIRYYLENNKIVDIYTDNEEILKPLRLKPRKAEVNGKIKEVRALIYSMPKETGSVEINHPIRAEIHVSEAKAKEILGKVIKFSDIYKVGELLDVASVSKGKGWQGEIKRFGVAKQRRKATGKVRHVGTLGPWHPHYVMYYVPRSGQMGYHNRVELNKQIILISNEKLERHLDHYGFTKSEYVLVKGSIPGPVKRPVFLRSAIRPREPEQISSVKVIL